MSFQTVFLAVLTFLAIANAHVLMKSPVPYSVEKLDNGPVKKPQYPCKSQNGFTVSTMNAMAVGEKQKLVLEGSAVHKGGSCQLSVSLDTEPTPSSVFKVIKSMMGGCPGVDDKEGAGSYEFELPASIPNGNATFAWTWSSKITDKEFYMNCAPIEVSGGASDNTAFNELPDMLPVNLDESCTSVDRTAIQYPNPGSVVQMGSTNDLMPPVGNGCGSTSGTTPEVPSAPDGETPAPPNSPAAGQSSTAAASPSATPYNPGGVFAPGASSATPIPSGGAPLPSTKTTLLTVTASPSPAKPPSGGNATPTPPTAPASGGNTACSEDGATICNGTSQFGICNRGQVTWQAVAPGTTCSNGVITKREYNGRIARSRIVRSMMAALGRT